MEFTFANSVFSFIVAFVAAIFGVTYPLILDSISNIDKKYKMSILTTHFQSETVVELYQKLLVPTVIVVFVIPFIMFVIDTPYVVVIILSVQCVLLLGLVITLLYLFYVIRIYYNPVQLTERLLPKPDDKVISDTYNRSILKIAVELMRYSCERPNADVYEACASFVDKMVWSEMEIERQSFTNSNYTIKDLKGYQFSDEVWEALMKLTEYSRNTKLLPLCHNNLLAASLYQIFFHYTLDEKCYNKLWYALYLISQSVNFEWFRQYWEHANQYYSSEINSNPQIYIQDKDGTQIKRRFLEFQFMVGALLMQSKKYEWLNYIMSYDRTQPPNYYLIPGTFQEIMDNILNLEAYCDCGIKNGRHRSLELTARYQMKDSWDGFDPDGRIILWGYRYAALLFVRSLSYTDDNINSSNPSEMLRFITNKGYTFQSVLNSAVKLKNEIDSFCPQIIGSLKIGLPKSDIKKASQKVTEYINAVN